MVLTRLSNLRGAVRVGACRLFSAQAQADAQCPVSLQRLPGSDGRVALYGLASAQARNALGHEMVRAMREVHDQLRRDTRLSVVIVHSQVPGIFCAGANLKERFKMTDEEASDFVYGLRATLTEVEDLPMPTIAALDGVAVGGGLELALACDLRVAARGARLGLVETGRGLIPGAGGTQRLPRLLHPSIAKELIFTSRIIDGDEAKQIGLVNHVVPQNSNKNAAFEKAIELAKEIIVNAPIALRCAKQAINEGLQGSIQQGCEVEHKWYRINLPTQDRQEGMISFMEKRKPNYQGN